MVAVPFSEESRRQICTVAGTPKKTLRQRKQWQGLACQRHSGGLCSWGREAGAGRIKNRLDYMFDVHGWGVVMSRIGKARKSRAADDVCLSFDPFSVPVFTGFTHTPEEGQSMARRGAHTELPEFRLYRKEKVSS
jgi:hypothetical protein